MVGRAKQARWACSTSDDQQDKQTGLHAQGKRAYVLLQGLPMRENVLLSSRTASACLCECIQVSHRICVSQGFKPLRRFPRSSERLGRAITSLTHSAEGVEGIERTLREKTTAVCTRGARIGRRDRPRPHELVTIAASDTHLRMAPA
jgi:hypothetical protein